MYLPQYTERKGSKIPENRQMEHPDTLRNQQVRCSSHPTSSKKRRKLRFSMLFCYKNATNIVGQGVGQILPHTLTYIPKCAERVKEHRSGSYFRSDAPFYMKDFIGLAP